MSFLTDAELTQLRADMLDLLPSTCTIKRRTITNDKGHPSEALTTVASNVACRIDPYKRTDSAGIVAMQEAGVTWWQLSVPYDTDLADKDVIEFDSDTYRLIQLYDDHSARAVRRGLLARKG